MENGQETYEKKTPPADPTKNNNFDSTPKIGVVVAFSLPAASYATMLLREFLSNNDESENALVEKGTEDLAEDEDAEEDEAVTEAC